MKKRTAFALAVFALAAATSACGSDTEATPILSSEEESAEISYFVGSAEVSRPYLDTSNVGVDENGVYTVAGFSIKLPAEFKTQHVDDLALYASDNERATVVLSVEDLSSIYDAGLDTTMSAVDYAKLVVKADETIQTPVYTKGDGAYFEYVKDIGDGQYRYFAYAYKGSEAFYLLQFCCAEDDTAVQREAFEQIEKSVTVS